VVYRGQAPNVRGAHRAIEARVGEMLGLITVSETYTLHNQNMTNDKCVEQNIQMFRLAEQNNIPFVAAIGMAFWCAYEGRIPYEKVEHIVGASTTPASSASTSPAPSAWRTRRT
jgi:hydroxymethylglutaryl-CoA lyase